MSETKFEFDYYDTATNEPLENMRPKMAIDPVGRLKVTRNGKTYASFVRVKTMTTTHPYRKTFLQRLLRREPNYYTRKEFDLNLAHRELVESAQPKEQTNE